MFDQQRMLVIGDEFSLIWGCLVKCEMCDIGSQLRKWSINRTESIFELSPDPNVLKQDKMVHKYE